jgi:acetolactate synthase I/III small subunit
LCGDAVARERAMVKAGSRERDKAQRVTEAFRARFIDASIKSFVFELAGAVGKIDQLIKLMRPIGLVEVSRTGVASMSHGKDPA